MRRTRRMLYDQPVWVKRGSMRSQRTVAVWVSSVLALFAVSGLAAADTGTGRDDRNFIRGYAAGVLENIYALEDFSLDFEEERRMVVVDFSERPKVPLDTLGRSLLSVDGVERAQILISGVVVAEASSPQGDSGWGALLWSTAPDSEGEANAETETKQRYDLLSPHAMFASLFADPRWPRFSASLQSYLDEDQIGQGGSATFGESFGLVRSPDHTWGQWELGLQAGVFSIFDLEASSNDLVNSDFIVGLTATYGFGDVTSILRVFHQSSHLGDEFLLRNAVDRVNLSFEVVDLIVSVEPWEWFRIYAGGGVIVHRVPALERGTVQVGTELRSPVAIIDGFLRPIAGVDFQFREESDWDLDASVRTGFQVEHPYLRRMQFRVLAEFYSGRSPNGQFYDRRIKTAGIGFHLGF